MHNHLSLISGTCVNNTSIMMFKKGSFEIGATIYPVAIKVTTLLCNQVILLKVNVFIAHLLIIELTLFHVSMC